MKIALNAPTEFVTINGEAWDGRRCQRESVVATPKKRANGVEASHKGWRVVGLPPGSVEDAKSLREMAIRDARVRGTKLPLPWDEAAYVATARRKPVRAKPYELREAADQCADMARKAGWIAVEVLALSKG